MDIMNEYMKNMTSQSLEAVNDFSRMWMELASKIAIASAEVKPGATPPEVTHQIRDSIMKAMTDYYQQLLRNPQFLETLRQSTDLSLTMRKAMDNFLTQSHHAAQGTAREDIDTLMLAIRHMETRILDRMERLAMRLEDLEYQVKEMARNGHGAAARAERAEPAPARRSVRSRAGARKKSEPKK